MKKRLLTIMLASVMAFSVTACGDKKDSVESQVEKNAEAAENMVGYVDKSERTSDVQLCDTIRSAMITSIVDVSANYPSFNPTSMNGNHSLQEILSFNPTVTQAFFECLGISDVSDITASIKSDEGKSGTLCMEIVDSQITVYIEGTTIGAGPNTALYQK